MDRNPTGAPKLPRASRGVADRRRACVGGRQPHPDRLARLDGPDRRHRPGSDRIRRRDTHRACRLGALPRALAAAGLVERSPAGAVDGARAVGAVDPPDRPRHRDRLGDADRTRRAAAAGRIRDAGAVLRLCYGGRRDGSGAGAARCHRPGVGMEPGRDGARAGGFARRRRCGVVLPPALSARCGPAGRRVRDGVATGVRPSRRLGVPVDAPLWAGGRGAVAGTRLPGHAGRRVRVHRRRHRADGRGSAGSGRRRSGRAGALSGAGVCGHRAVGAPSATPGRARGRFPRADRVARARRIYRASPDHREP